MPAPEDEGEVPITPDEREQRLTAELGERGLIAIDEAILGAADLHWRKVARVVVRACNAQGVRLTDEHVHLYVRRLILLVDAGLLESQGNVRQPRWSEVRLVARGTA
jgi:hypothetical protein